MADKKILFAGAVADMNAMQDLAATMQTFSASQKHALFICAEGYLPAHIEISQRTFKGAIEIDIKHGAAIVCAKISPRGKLWRALVL